MASSLPDMEIIKRIWPIIRRKISQVKLTPTKMLELGDRNTVEAIFQMLELERKIRKI